MVPFSGARNDVREKKMWAQGFQLSREGIEFLLQKSQTEEVRKFQTSVQACKEGFCYHRIRY